MARRYDKEFLKRYLNDECSEEEKAFFLKWLESDREMEVDLWMQHIWQQPPREEHGNLGAEQRILSRLQGSILQERGTASGKSANARNNRSRILAYGRHLVRYAAVLLLILISVFLIKTYTDRQQGPEESQASFRIKDTRKGQKMTFFLEDGTKVTLNASSQIQFPEHFDDSSRTVTLHGEAFFSVARDAHRPFRVIAADLQTVALGTSFNVLADTFEHEVAVSLVTGKVAVQELGEASGSKVVTLEPGEEVVFDTSSKIMRRGTFDYNEKVAWKDGVLYFSGDDMATMVDKLEHWYGVDIEVYNKPAQDWIFTAKFKDQSLEQVLEGIAFAKEIEYTISGKNVQLVFK